MDTIREYKLEATSGQHTINVPKNSNILSVRKRLLTDDIMVGVLVDLDVNEMVDKHLLIYTPEDHISDNMKADFVGVVTLGVSGAKQFYVFEKLN